MKKIVLFISVFTCLFQISFAQGIVGQKAPEINVDKWVHLPDGQKTPTNENLKDKVVYIYCYQSWCPGCHSSGFPTLSKVSEEFKESEDVKFLVIQTVFEGFSVNTPEKWKDIANKYKLTNLPFAHSGTSDKRSAIMADYKTRGTPWTIIIGKDGKVKYNAFHIKSDDAIALINVLKKN